MSNKRGKNHFKDEWLQGNDSNGDRLTLYIQSIGRYNVKCGWCKKDICIENMGRSAIMQHAKSNGHKLVADLRKGRKADQVILAVEGDRTESEEEDIPENNNIDEEDRNVGGETEVETPMQKKRGIKKFFLQSSAPAPVVQNDNLPKKASLQDKVTRAEILVSLQGISSNYSYWSMDGLSEIIRRSFNDSKIAEKFTLNHSKASYVVSHGLGPYFHSEIVQDINKAEVFTLGTDSATTKHLGLSKAMDIKIRYYSEKYGEVRQFKYPENCFHIY